MYFTNFDASIRNLLLMIIGITLINYIYENGYIQNDIILTKKEKNPNLRVSGNQLNNIREHIKQIFYYRILTTAILLVVLWFIANDIITFIKYIIVLTLLQCIYLIYNSIRNIGNFYLILPLSYLRFYGFILPLISMSNLIEFIIVTVLLYPLNKLLEFSKQPRYNFKKLSIFIGNIDSFRIKYYFLNFIFFYILYFIFDISIEYIYIILYYLLFRIATYIAIKNNKTIKNDIQKNTKNIYREN